MKKDTKKLLVGGGILAGLVALLAAATSSAKPAPKPSSPGTPPGPTSPAPPPSSEPPVQPPGSPPPPAPPASTAPPQNAPAVDTSTFPKPAGTVAALAVLSEWNGTKWVEKQRTELDYTTVIPDLSLDALYKRLTQYSPVTQPPYQNVQLFVYSAYTNPGWQPSPISPSFYNYTPAGKGLVGWTWTRVWRWTNGAFQIENDTGWEQSVIEPMRLANALQNIESPPYYFFQVFRWSASTQTAVYAAHAKNY